jgi:hypothetical protein
VVEKSGIDPIKQAPKHRKIKISSYTASHTAVFHPHLAQTPILMVSAMINKISTGQNP